MEVYLIRHTQPLIEKGLIYGRTDVPLAESFTTDKDRILKQLPAAFDAVYSSPSLRCTRLAEVISTQYLIDESLCELNFGDWEGQTWDTVNRQDSELWMNDFVNLSPPGGETMREMESRVMNFWNILLKKPFNNVTLITHGGVIRIILAHYQSVALKDSFTIPVGMGEVFRLSVSGL
jgi:alpha-ribazole phosphatase